mmetsp:Transcript_24090/g.81220  ORF Transcript_24090/g.81220 Transcript_24090/m.81220 type:complete len:95 (-) Transcript_24090:198-482(-)
MLRINCALGLHEVFDSWVNASLIDTRDLDVYGLGRRRRAVDYWAYVAVSPRRGAPEWSPLRCDAFSSTGLPPASFDEHGNHNDYENYDAAFAFR